jgi:uncharacterized cupin superfamily protein
VQIIRLYTGDDGEAHFEDLTPDQLAEVVSRVGDSPIELGHPCTPFSEDFHPARRHQYAVMLAGVIEFETGDGSMRRLRSGDVLVAEDLTGRGHIRRGFEGESCYYLMVPLAN